MSVKSEVRRLHRSFFFRCPLKILQYKNSKINYMYTVVNIMCPSRINVFYYLLYE